VEQPATLFVNKLGTFGLKVMGVRPIIEAFSGRNGSVLAGSKIQCFAVHKTLEEKNRKNCDF
jgi:hypothetical protein